jgi:hypothetical protein
MISPLELLKDLEQENLFLDWKKQNPENFLSHFFTPLSSDFRIKANWEVGFFNKEKITVFVPIENGFAIKPADDVFKKPDAKVEKLVLKDVKLTFEEALEVFKKNLPDKFPNEQLGDGFIILQTYQGKTLWNFTFITKKLKFVNLKINSLSGNVEDSQEIDLVQKS